MPMLKKIVFILSIMVVSTSLNASSRATLNLGDKDVELGFDLDMGDVIESYGKGGYFVGLGFMSNQGTTGYQMFQAKMFMEDEMSHTTNVRIALGMKAVYTTLGGVGYVAFPVGGHIDYRVNQIEGMMFISDLFFAPAPLALSPAGSYFETRLGVAFEPVENMRFFMEYRLLFTNFETDTVSRLYGSTLAFGARIGF